MSLRALALTVAACLSFPAAADVYRWVDSRGDVHYTDDPSTIPQDRRAAAKKTEGDEITQLPNSVPLSPSLGEGGGGETGIKPSWMKPKLDEEQLWRSRYQQAREKLGQAEQAVKTTRETLKDPDAHGIPSMAFVRGEYRPNPAVEEVRQRLAKEEAALAQAKAALEELDGQASRAGIPSDWRR